MSIEIHGLGALLGQLERLKTELAAKALAAAARRAFKPVLDAAKRMAPRDSGALADAIKLKVEKPKHGDSVINVGLMIGSSRLAKQARLAAAALGEAQAGSLPPARRWHFIELGTSHNAGHPYLRPALDANAPLVLELLKVELRRAIDKAVKK